MSPERGEDIDEGDRRRYKRVSPSCPVEAHIDGAGVVHVIGLGIGGTGMRIITDRSLSCTEIFNIALTLHKGHPPLNLRGRVAWRSEEDFGYCRRFFFGIEFSEIAERDQEMLLLFMRDLCEED